MTAVLLDRVMAIEVAAYAAPWSRGNFADSLASGCFAKCLFDARDNMLGYCVAMQGAGEMHLLNVTVSPLEQHRGHARHMLQRLLACSQANGMDQIWLEVRESNLRARSLYRGFGFTEVGVRKAYYPAASGGAHSAPEDAVAMSLLLDRSAR